MAVNLQHTTLRSAPEHAQLEMSQKHQESQRHRPESLGGSSWLTGVLGCPPLKALGIRDTAGFIPSPLPPQGSQGVTDQPLGEIQESQEFFFRGIITPLYFIINYSQYVDFTMIYREQETLPIFQFFLFQRQVAPTATCLWPWHPAKTLFVFHGAPSLLPPLTVPSPETHEGVKIWHFFLDLCSLEPYPWYITANQAAACLLWLFWEVITLLIHQQVELIQAIFLIHGLAHSIAIFHGIWYFAIIIVSPFEDSDKGQQDIFSN